jgi:hyperpolarization activated cyclic nucleotide-gated potassium channel 1
MLLVPKNEYIYMQGDPAEEMYFIKSGKVAAVLPNFRNFKYIFVK